jgi:hypothetical protein
VVVHVSMTVTAPASHAVFGAQAGPPPLPEQAVEVSSWQTMPAPQSASALQAFGWQVLYTTGSAVVEGAQSAPLQGGLADVPDTTQENPCRQSLSVVQVWAEAVEAPAKQKSIAASARECRLAMFVSPARNLKHRVGHPQRTTLTPVPSALSPDRQRPPPGKSTAPTQFSDTRCRAPSRAPGRQVE